MYMQEQEPIPEEEKQPEMIDFKDADVSKRYNDVYQTIVPDRVDYVVWRDESYEFVCHNGVAMRIQAPGKGILRIRYAYDGQFAPDFSYALSPDFKPEKIAVSLQENESEYLLSTGLIHLVVAKQGLQLRFYDSNDRVMCEDAGGYSVQRTVMQGLSSVKIEKKHRKRMVYTGLGDKSCELNLSGKKFENWCTDAYAFGPQTDPLYRAVPFYCAIDHGLAYGVLLDNTYRSRFDFDSSDNGIMSFAADGGEMNYYFLYGPHPEDVVRAYAGLCGVHALPPVWALGYHQCRWSYYPEARVREIAARFRELEIPCDAIYLDIDYMDGFRCFTWNNAYFPDPAGLIADLRALGFETVVMVDPGLKEDPDYAVYRDGLEQGMFCFDADGQVAKAPVWPGFCAFPDFTAEKVRKWWGDLHRELYAEQGVSGFWNDMNEPAVFHVNHKTLPDMIRHDLDGQPGSHKKAHNVYGMQMTRASWEGMRRLQPDKRPYLLTRASFCGGQRYAAVWTGDNCSDWDHLQIANLQCQRLAVSGFSFCGTDIGGFAGAPEPELFIRWLQLAVFHPLMRVHSMAAHASGDALPVDEAQLSDPAWHRADQEPWSFGDKWTDLAKKAIELRYCLLPCLYTAMWRHSQDGSPVLRHLGFADPADLRMWEQERDFLFGEHLLVSPVIQPKVQRQGVFLPPGNWYYFWNGQAFSGDVFVNVTADQIPFFVREGAVLPIHPVRQFTAEKAVEELSLYVYYKNGRESSSLYEDAGEGYVYLNNGYCLYSFDTEGTETSFSLNKRQKGLFQPSYRRIKLFLIGFPVFLKHCSLDGREMPIKEIRIRDRSVYTLEVTPEFETVVWEG